MQKEKDEKANLVNTKKKSESTLLMAFSEELEAILLQGQDGDVSSSDLWHLYTGATNHMTGEKDLFCHFDSSRIGRVIFGDG